MPYLIVKSPGGYFVKNRLTGKLFSKSALPYSRAEKQLKALEIHTHE